MNRLTLVILAAVFFASCKKKTDDVTVIQDNVEFSEMIVEEGFNFRTSEQVTLRIYDSQTARYDIFSPDQEEEYNKMASVFTKGGQAIVELVLPIYYNTVILQRKGTDGSLANYTVDVNSDEVSFNVSNQRTKKSGGCSETLFYVSGDGYMGSLDVENNYAETVISTSIPGGGSISCAYDKNNDRVWYHKSGSWYYYDVAAANFVTYATGRGNPYGNSSNFPRMEYDNDNEVMYVSNGTTMHKINPLTGATLQSYSISGMESPTNGGDLAISQDGTFYLCAFSGLYRLTFNGGSSVSATRISAENLPFSPTSMAIDREDRLYLATNESNARIIEMNKIDGSWVERKTVNHKVNDLGSEKCLVSELANTDSDSDGIIDALDDYPNDANLATNVFTPSELGRGSLGFEDLWPGTGDYDFNDLVVRDKIIQRCNASNQVVSMRLTYQVKAIGASYHNGFGVQLPFSESLISNVSGYNITANGATLNSKGLEDSQTSPVIIIFDDAFDNGNYGACGTTPGDEVNIEIVFNSPVNQNLIDVNAFNYFIFRTEERGLEIHLKGFAPTDLADNSYFGTVQDRTDVSQGNYYYTANGLPWGIHIIHEFRQMQETRSITSGYNHLSNWATSNGSVYTDWYKDNAGFRNTSNICTY